MTSRVVEGEEEAQFWKEANEKRAVERTKKGDRFGGNKRGVRSKRNRRGGQKRKYNQGLFLIKIYFINKLSFRSR